MSDVQVAVRLTAEIVAKLDAEAAKISAMNPGIRVTRASVLRMLALRGLASAEAEMSKPRRSRQRR